ncbi:MAG: UDP-N-acetylmuramoyl-L-alanyl-D-glutamate--2,6-diaminopimelate ligase [Clostridia bacterium]
MKKIKELLSGLNYEVINEVNYESNIHNIYVDSREVTNNSMFICITGEHHDGHNYASQAVKNGAVVLVVEKEVDIDVSQILVKNTKKAISKIAANYYNNPSKQMNVIGITGTNGKTTTTYIIKHIFDFVGQRAGLIGTIGVNDGEQTITASLTTPQPLEIHKYFYKMYKNTCKHVVMEVSSHALALSRVDDVDFNIVALTNISQDHLDYHKNMEEYIKAKTKLFKMANSWAIINHDEIEHKKFAKNTDVDILYYSCKKAINDGLYAIINRASGEGTDFTVFYENNTYNIKTDLVGKFNVYNILLAIGIALKSDIEMIDIVNAVNSFKSVPGRFEKVNGINKFSVIVDYAHTPDALENVLKSAKSLTKNNLIVVFGCGGDRDKTKRPIMGKIAAQYGDFVIVTSDNPRTEDPKIIIEEIIRDIRDETYVKIEVDRKEAIKNAVMTANDGDIIIIAGKGHETYQIIGNTKYDFDDRLVAKNIYGEVK